MFADWATASIKYLELQQWVGDAWFEDGVFEEIMFTETRTGADIDDLFLDPTNNVAWISIAVTPNSITFDTRGEYYLVDPDDPTLNPRSSFISVGLDLTFLVNTTTHVYLKVDATGWHGIFD